MNLTNAWEEVSSAPRLPPLRRVLGVALLLASLSAASQAVNQSSWNSGGVTILWPTNGLLMGVLLCNPKRHWRVYLGVAGLIDLALNLSLGDTFQIGLYLTSCNLLEAALGALLLFRVIAPKPDLTQRRQLIAFLSYGVFLAPLVASTAASIVQDGYLQWPTFHNVHRWFTADALGVATVTPLYLAYRQKDRFGGRSWAEIFGLFTLLSLATFGVFWQRQFPLLFILLPVFLLLGLRLRLAGSALGLLLVSIMGGLLVTAGRGPTSLIQTDSPLERDLVFQCYIAVCMLLLYLLEVRLAESDRLRANLEASERRFRLLAEASQDIIFRCDMSGRRTYVSPSVTEILGWAPEELLGETYHDLVHPEDKGALACMLETFRREKRPPARAEYRYRKADGSYLWLEFNPKLFYDGNNGEPAGYVNVARDISLRKLEEADMQRTLATAEQLAISDPLTGISNRRHFNLVMEREWLRAAREQTSLTVLLIDVDHFKVYNDLYGHLAGDECLKQVVAAILPVIRRPADLLARYGGEEFVAVLPNTDVAGARLMAEKIREAVECCACPHPGNPPSGVITICVGCATSIPQPQLTYLHLLEAADQALYRAKASGRNCVKITETILEGKAGVSRG